MSLEVKDPSVQPLTAQADESVPQRHPGVTSNDKESTTLLEGNESISQQQEEGEMKEVEDGDEAAAKQGDEAEAKENFWSTPEAQSLREDSSSKKGLSILWDGSQRREQAQHALENALETSKVGMEAVLQEGIVNAVVEPFLQDWTSIFEKMESEIIHGFESNTRRRWNMQGRIDKYNKHWNQQYQQLTARILDTPTEEEEEEKQEGTGEEGKKKISSKDSSGDDGNHKTGDESPSKDSQASSQEPDWSSLLSQTHVPTVERARRFLGTRDRLHMAEDQFRCSIDEIQNKFMTTTDELVQIAVDVHNPLDDALGAEESELQYYLVRNLQRRQALAQAVEESAKQAQGIFARLMARVKSLTGSKRKRDADAA